MENIEKFAIYTMGEVYPVIKVNGKYLITREHNSNFSGEWEFLGVIPRLKGMRNIIGPNEALNITDWKFKNGTPRYCVVDKDHGSVRVWRGTNDSSQLLSFGKTNDGFWNIISDNDIKLNESKNNLTESKDDYWITEFNKLKQAYNPYKEDSDEIKAKVKELLINAPNGLKMYRVNKDTTSGWTSHGGYTDERTVKKLYTKENDMWTMYGSKKNDIDDAVLGILFNDGLFMTEEEANNEVNKQKVNDKSYHRDIVNVGTDSAGNPVGKSTNRVTSINENKNIEESKKYAVYATYGGDGVYNSKLVDTVDSEEQAVDRVAELQATGVGASYEEVETKNEECSQASGVASGVNGKIDSFPINPKEMEKQRLKEDINNPYFVIEDIGAAYLMAGPFKTKVEAERKKKEQIKEYNLEEEAEIIHVWDWNTIKEFEDNAYDTYQEFINAGDSAPYYKEEKLEESKRLSEGKKIDISNFEDVNYCVAGTKDMLYSDDVSNVTFVSTEEEAKEQIKAYEQQGLKYSAYKDITDIKNIILNIVNRFKNNSNLKFEVDTTVFIRYSDNKIIIGMINYSLDISKTDINKYNYVDICLHDYTPAEYNKYSGHTEYFVFSDNKKLKSIPNKNINSIEDVQNEIINYVKQWLGTDYVEDVEDDSLFEALKELINYLNKNTKYNWDANEMYDNCAITESDTDYIEVFVDIKDGNKIYTVDNYSYNSLEELVKNMPVLFTDEDEDYDYDEGWEKEEESTRLALSGKLLESSVYQEGQPFQPDKRDLLKMKEYKDKGSNPSAMAKSVKDINKALSRYFIACAMEWKSAKEAFYERILDLVGWSQSDKYRNIMEDLESQATNYEIPDEFKANTGTTEFPIDEKSENHLRDWYSKLYKVLKQNNLEYKLTQRAPTQQEMETDNINGRHWAIACTLTVKLPDGEVKDIYLCNDTNEGGGSFSVSSSTLGVWEGNQQQLADAFQELINKHSKKEEGKFKEQDMPVLFTNEDYNYDSNWKNDLEETYNKLTELNDYNTDGKYVITYGRGDSIFFNSLEDAKAWQVKNIWNDDYANYQIEDPEDEDNPVRYDWEDIREETDGNYLYEFVMYDKNGNKYDTDTTDGAGWFIQPNFINEL